MRDTPERFSALTIALHWLVGITIIGLLGVGWYMAEYDAYGLYPWHKSTGILVLSLVLVRVWWRLLNGWPAPASQYQAWEQVLARVVHWVLLIGIVLMPLSGMLMSGAGGHGLDLFGLQLLAANPDPSNPGQVLALNKTAAELGHQVHNILSSVLITAVVLHVAGALKHHLIDKDGTLRRMLGARIDPAQ